MVKFKKFRAKGFDGGFAFLTFGLLMLVLIGNWWMLQNDVKLAVVYFSMITGSIMIIVMAMVFIKGDDLKRISQFIKAPFSTSPLLTAFSFLVGFIFAFAFEFTVSLLSRGSLSITNFSVPLFTTGNSLSVVSQSFSAAVFNENMPWKIFNISFNAGIVEEFTFSFALMIAGVMIALLFLKTFFNGESPIGSKQNFVLVFAIIFASLLFMGAHGLNATYTRNLFIIALIFKLVTLALIYLTGLFLSFVIAYHAANNLIFLIQTDGLPAVLAGFQSGFGVFFLIFFGGLIFYLVRNRKQLFKELGQYFSSG